MARTAQDVLEFDKLRELLRLRTTCVLGKRAVDALEPGTDQRVLETAFAHIREAREWLRAERELGFGGVADPQHWLERIEGPGVVLDAAELLVAASLLETAGWLRQQFNADAGEDYVTLRNDRFVIPVRVENRRSVPGIMHGTSGTGQTVFLEPFETVETNNQLVQLGEEEAAEIVRILRELTERLQLLRGPLIAAAETIGELDSIFARARFARDFDAAMPEFTAQGELRLEEARQ